MSVNIVIKGADEIIRALDKLAREDVKIGQTAVRRAASQYRKDVKAVLPRSEGEKIRAWKTNENGGKHRKRGDIEDVHVQDSIAIRKQKGREVMAYNVGVVGLAKAYAHVLEFGSKNMAGRRYFTKTLEANTQKYFEIMKKEIRDALYKVVK